MKTSFISTVFNEETTISRFLDSLYNQKVLPKEIIIVDGGSIDKTTSIVKKYITKFKKKKITFHLYIKKGNRSVGRNEAISKSNGNIILCSDSGNILDKLWIKNIIYPFTKKHVDVVAGYYHALADSVFQESLTPYVLVMQDKINEKDFLPATRSIAFKKKIWREVGGFDERFSHNEDYVFARKLRSIKANIVFAKDAIVNWIPRSSYKGAFIMFFRFAYGDLESGIIRDKVLLLFARYLLAFYILFLCLLYKSRIGFMILLLLPILYVIWSIYKNYKYINKIQAFYYLPVFQFISDGAVLSGSTLGFIKLMIRKL